MIYVLSDIHGHEGRFNSILKQIHLQPEDTLYVLGDVVDRHPGGIRILRRLMAMPNARMLLGNHEYMMLRALGEPYDDIPGDGRSWDHWHRNGGDATYASWRRNRKSLRQEILDYLHSLPLSADVWVNGTHYKLVHAAPPEEYDPADNRYKNPAYYAVWKRFDPDHTFPGDYFLVFGHTPTVYYQDRTPMEIWQQGRLIGIDCGSGAEDTGPEAGKGRLACLRLDDGKIFYSREETR